LRRIEGELGEAQRVIRRPGRDRFSCAKAEAERRRAEEGRTHRVDELEATLHTAPWEFDPKESRRAVSGPPHLWFQPIARTRRAAFRYFETDGGWVNDFDDVDSFPPI